MTRRRITAWFGSDHPAWMEHCTECKAHGGQPCTTEQTNGGRVAIAGMHAARIDAARKREAA